MIKLSWSEFKSEINSRDICIQCKEETNLYDLYAHDAQQTFNCIIFKESPANADQIDFENNYKSYTNQKLGNLKFDNNGRAKVSLTIDGTLTYEDMNSNTGGIARETLIGNTYTTLYEYTGSGSIIGFVTRLEKADTESWTVRVVADETNLLNITTAELRDVYKLEDDLTAKVMGVGINGESFRFSSSTAQPLTFNSNIKIQAKKTVGGSKKFKGGLVSVVKV